jgi:hypothetical protein
VTTDLAPVPHHTLRLEERDLETLRVAARNANVMADDVYQALVEEIRAVGFIDPVLITADGEIIDGHHRVRAAYDLGMASVPCIVVADESLIAKMREAVALGLNGLRGKTNQTIKAAILVDLAGSYTLEVLAPVVGMAVVDLQELIAPPKDALDLSGLDAGDSDSALDRERPERPFALDGLTFRSARTLRDVKRALRKAAGKGRDLSVGLLNLLSIEDK